MAILLLVVLSASVAAYADVSRQLSSAHFRITYRSGSGAGAVSADYARWVQESLETSYSLLIDQWNFPVFPRTIDVRIVEFSGGEMGGEYLEYDAHGIAYPVIEIATSASMEESLATMYVDVSLRDAVLSTAAHELFHVVQDYASIQGSGDLSEESFIEAHATAIQELVAPDANDYLEPAIDLLLAPDSVSFFHRRYDAGVFWVFYMSRYGGADSIRDVMAATAAYEGRNAVDRALDPVGGSFAEAWGAFTVAFATESLPDQAAIRAMSTQVRFDLGVRTLSVPTPVVIANWTGDDLSIDRVTVESPSLGFTYYEEDPVGAELRVAHAYGIDVVSVTVRSDRPMVVDFLGDSETAFQVLVAGKVAQGWENLSTSADRVLIAEPIRYSQIRIAVTRGEEGNGTYQIRLSSPLP